MIKILFSKVITMFFLISLFHQTMESKKEKSNCGVDLSLDTDLFTRKKNTFQFTKKKHFFNIMNQVAFHFDVFSYFVSVRVEFIKKILIIH